MNYQPGEDRKRKERSERAAAYFSARHGASLEEREDRDAWLASDEKNSHEYLEISRAWDLAASLSHDQAMTAVMEADLAQVRKDARSRRTVLRASAAAAVVTLMLAGGYLLIALRHTPSLIYATEVGEQRTSLLTDGSTLVLNTDTVVSVTYSDEERSIDIDRGEAHFQVAHDEDRPFVVKAGSGRVVALGTVFQVRRDGGQTSVTLLEGSVEVSIGNVKRVLSPDQMALLSESAGISVGPSDVASRTAWLDGWLKFRDESLGSVIAEANRYSSQKIRLSNPLLEEYRLSGSFRAGDNASIADAASMILPVRVDRRGSEIVIAPK